MNFLTVEKKRQLAWKLTTKTLPREAKTPGLFGSCMFPFCLPLEHAGLNLYCEIRDEALELFARLGIVWHTSALPGLPTNHLCSSQVFCVNSLAPFLHRAEALADLLRHFFPDLLRVLPVEEDRFVAFEFIDPDNLLGEVPKLGATRHRGAGSTSIDAAILYESQAGDRTLLFIEWKYSESYPSVYKRFQELGSDFYETWKKLLIEPKDFVFIPTEELFRSFPIERHQELTTGQKPSPPIPVVDTYDPAILHTDTPPDAILGAIGAFYERRQPGATP